METFDEIKRLAAAGDIARAEEALKELLAAEPENLEAKRLYGTCRQLLGDEETFRRIHAELAPMMENIEEALLAAIREINRLLSGHEVANAAPNKSGARLDKFNDRLTDVVELLGVADSVHLQRSTMDALFRLKDQMVEARINIPKPFVSRFVNVVCTYVLDDEESPGEIDEKEAKWLRSRTLLNGQMDFVDKRLLKVLKSKSLNNPAVLSYKGLCSRTVERILYSFRCFTWTAIIGSLSAAAALFIGGTCSLASSIFRFFMPDSAVSAMIEDCVRMMGMAPEGGIKDLETLQGSLVTVIDVYLFAMVLLIFGVGIYELFINQIDPVEDNRNSRPSWLHVTSIDDLKASLGKSILMVLIVSLYKYALKITAASTDNASVLNLLHFAGVIVLVALSLFLTSLSAHKRPAAPDKKKAKR